MPSGFCGMRGAWLSSLISKNSKTISNRVQSRSDPKGGGGFNRAARSPPGQVRGDERREKWAEGREKIREDKRREEKGREEKRRGEERRGEERREEKRREEERRKEKRREPKENK